MSLQCCSTLPRDTSVHLSPSPLFPSLTAPPPPQFVEGGMAAFPFYVQAKRLNACWGDDPEIQALCELYNRPAEIWA